MNYGEIYAEVWNFHKKHNARLSQDSEAFWKLVIEDGRAIEHKFNSDPFVVDLLVSIVSELERKKADT